MKNYPRIPMKTKDYGTRVQTDNISNIPILHAAMSNTAMIWPGGDDPTGPRLLGDNRESFKRLFGKPDFYFVGEFRFHCYALDLGKAKLLLLTAKGKGTSYEVIFSVDGQKVQKDAKTIIEFLYDLREEL